MVPELLPPGVALYFQEALRMQTTLTVPKLACSACVETVTKAIQQLDPQAQVQVDPKTKQVVITSEHPVSDLRQALAQAGYPPQ
ncbi:MAG: heavy-metal-associated domain-containing protein [Cyanobacteriota bacterium]